MHLIAYIVGQNLSEVVTLWLSYRWRPSRLFFIWDTV